MTKCLAQLLLLRHEGPLQSMDIIDYEGRILTLRAIWNALQLLICKLLVCGLGVEWLLWVGTWSVGRRSHLGRR